MHSMHAEKKVDCQYAIQTIDGESQIKSVCVKSIALAFKIGYSTNLLFCIIQDQSQHP